MLLFVIVCWVLFFVVRCVLCGVCRVLLLVVVVD